MNFDADDYSVIVKNRANPPKPWRWEIYRAGRATPIERSETYFGTMTMAQRAGKEAFELFLNNRFGPVAAPTR
jgi:hypothetical protein